jgi:hypothetical protein
MLLDVRRGSAGARAEIDNLPSIAAFDGGEDLVDHVRRQLSGRSGLQERDALRPVLFESVLRTLFDEERHASGKLGGEILIYMEITIEQGYLRLKIAEFEELQARWDCEVEDVDESRGSSEIGFGPGHA